MKCLAIDARYVHYENTGLGRFTFFLAHSILRYHSKNLRIILILNREINSLTNELFNLVDSNNCEVYYSNIRPFTLKNLFWFFIEVNRLKCDSYLHPHFDIPFFINKTKYIYIHDLFPLVVNNYIVKFKAIKKTYFALKVFYSTLVSKMVFTISKSTRKDLKKLFFVKKSCDIRITYLASTLLECVESIVCNLPVKYLVYVGDRRPHKNIKRTIELYKLLQSIGYSGKLLLVGSTKNYDINIDHFLNDDILALGNVTNEELVFIYKKCDSLVFLSDYEGFGLPVVECASYGKKVILSDGGSLVEIMPPWGYVIPNDEILELHHHQILSYINNSTTIDETYISSFSWKTLADKVMDSIYEN